MPPSPRNRISLTVYLGAFILLACELLLFADVHLTPRGVVKTQQQIDVVMSNEPATLLGQAARFVAVNMTALAWVGYLLLLDGILCAQRSGSPARRRRHHFWLLFLASNFIWCVFDYLNFHGGMRAWIYIGLPTKFSDKFLAYFLAFGTIVPGMLMSGQVVLNAGWFNWARTESRPLPRWVLPTSLIVGMAMIAWPILHPTPVTNLTLWTSLVFLLDPINFKLGRPSMFRDWQNGWYGRTLAACAGGSICGFLWEFWNYWALTKWTYHLPFLGWTEHIRYFEMPVIGLLGFIPFGMECWVMWQTIRIALDGLVEPIPDERCLL